jgi:hypothetical protein
LPDSLDFLGSVAILQQDGPLGDRDPVWKSNAN